MCTFLDQQPWHAGGNSEGFCEATFHLHSATWLRSRCWEDHHFQGVFSAQVRMKYWVVDQFLYCHINGLSVNTNEQNTFRLFLPFRLPLTLTRLNFFLYSQKPNLILNVDGFIGVAFVDLLRTCGGFTRWESNTVPKGCYLLINNTIFWVYSLKYSILYIISLGIAM